MAERERLEQLAHVLRIGETAHGRGDVGNLRGARPFAEHGGARLDAERAQEFALLGAYFRDQLATPIAPSRTRD